MEDFDKATHYTTVNCKNVPDSGGSENISVDLAWQQGNYHHVLSLLLNDSEFPRGFDLEKLNEEDEDQKSLKEFAEKRNLLHEWIKEDKLKEVKDFIAGKKSRYYFNSDRKSAAFTALNCKNFQIYACLISGGVDLTPDSKNEMKNLTKPDKINLREVMLWHFPRSKKSHILYLKSRIKIKSKSDFKDLKKKLYGYLEKLDEIQDVSIMLKILQNVHDLDLVFDFDGNDVATVCPFASMSQKGITYHQQGTIYVAAGEEISENEILGTLAHEITHMAMELVFKNDSNPYFKNNNDSRNEFQTIVDLIQERLTGMNNGHSETLMRTFYFYKEEDQQGELIARVPHLLAQFVNGEIWLKDHARILLDFFKNKVIPECDKFYEKSVWLKLKNLSHHMNETEGEIIHLKKLAVTFKNVNELSSFLNDVSKKVFVLVTKCTGLGVLRALQAMYDGTSYFESYDHFLVFKLENCIENLEDVEFLFNSEATETLIVDCHDFTDNKYATLKGIEKIINIVKAKQNKKIVFIMKENENENFVKILNKQVKDLFIKKMDEDFSAWDLVEKSRDKILRQKVLFQEREYHLIDLINKDEDLLKCVDGETIEDLLHCKKIKIGSKPFGTSSLEGSYSDVVYKINTETLIHEMKFGKDIFFIIIYGIKKSNLKEELAKCLNEKIDPTIIGELKTIEHGTLNNKRIFITDEEISEDDFKKYCGTYQERKIFLLENDCNRPIPAFILSKLYNPDFYFQRQFEICEKRIIKKEELELSSLMSATSDKIIIANDPHNDMGLTTECANIIWNPEKIKSELEKCSQSSERVHILKRENNELIWEKSYGSFSHLNRWIDEERSRKSIVDEKQLIKKIYNEKVVILADDPGMGKSTTLTKLYEFEDQVIDTHWVIRINLKDHIHSIKKMTEDINVKHFIMILTKMDPNLANNITKRLLEAALGNNTNFKKPVLFAFDGFDELLDDNDRKKVIILLKFLKDSTKCKLWVTTRIHFQETLENELSSFSINFVHIDDSCKKNFIKNYMKERLRLLLSTNKYYEVFGENVDEGQDGSLLQIYSKSLIKRAESIFKGVVEKFIGTPLQLHILLEDSIGPFRDWVENPTLPPKFSYLGDNFFEAFKRFFKRKYEILFRKKNILEKSCKSLMKDSLTSHHEKLAESLILQEEIPRKVLKHKFLMLLVGILKPVGDNLEFTHFTFREYYFTRQLIKNLLYQQKFNFEEYSRFFWQDILVKDEYRLIRTFMNEYFKSTKITEVLRYPDGFTQANSWFRKEERSENCGFCIAIKEKNDNILQFLFSIEFTESDWFELLKHDKICANRILHLAIDRNNEPAFDLIAKLAFNIPSKVNLDHLHEFVTTVNQHKETVLHLAVANRNNYVFNRIIGAISTFNLEQKYEFLSIASASEDGFAGGTAMHIAIERENDIALKRILDVVSKFDPNKQCDFLTTANEFKETALHLAIRVKNHPAFNKIIAFITDLSFEIQCKLLSITCKSKGAPNETDVGTVLHMALASFNDTAWHGIREVFSKFNTDMQCKLLTKKSSNHEDTILHLAVKTKNDWALNQILETASILNLDQWYELITVVNRYGETVLHEAIKAKFALTQILDIFSKFSLNQQCSLLTSENGCKESVLQLAIDHQLLKIVYEAKKRDHVNLKRSGLHLSFQNQTFFLVLNQILEVALDLNADQQYSLLTVVNDDKETLLHLAVKQRDEEVLNRIFDITCKFNSTQQSSFLTLANRFEKTAFYLAFKMDCQVALNWILKIASTFDLKQQFTFLTIVNHAKETMLHTALKERKQPVFVELLNMASKCSSNHQYELFRIMDNRKETILHTAAKENNNVALLKLTKIVSTFTLDQRNKLLNIKNEDNLTAANLAFTNENSVAYNILDKCQSITI